MCLRPGPAVPAARFSSKTKREPSRPNTIAKLVHLPTPVSLPPLQRIHQFRDTRMMPYATPHRSRATHICPEVGQWGIAAATLAGPPSETVGRGDLPHGDRCSRRFPKGGGHARRRNRPGSDGNGARGGGSATTPRHLPKPAGASTSIAARARHGAGAVVVGGDTGTRRARPRVARAERGRAVARRPATMREPVLPVSWVSLPENHGSHDTGMVRGATPRRTSVTHARWEGRGLCRAGSRQGTAGGGSP
jgi:hypothetical protein